MKKYFITTILLVSCALPDEKLTIIGHRGASRHLPEHTLLSTALAHGLNVDFIEPDLVMTKDNKLIVMHDLHLDTTTNVSDIFPNKKRKDGRYYAIDFNLDEIKKLNVYERFDRNTKNNIFPNRFSKKISDFKVPTFEEFIDIVQSLNNTRHKDIGIYPETKRPEFHLSEGKDITKAMLDVLKKYNYEESRNAFIQSFWNENLKRLKFELKTNIPLIQLIGENSWKESSTDYDYLLTDEGLAEIATYAIGIGPSLSQVIKDPTLVKRAKKKGLLVHAYTYRSDIIPEGHTKKSYHKLVTKELGLHGIFTDL